MSSIGEILKTERIRQGKNLKEIEQETKIRAKYLLALEKNDFDSLPHGIYPKVFLRAYCQFLGIDSNLLLEKYNEEIDQKEEDSNNNIRFTTIKPPSNKFENLALVKNRIPRVRIAIFIIIILFIIYFAILRPIWSDPSKEAPPATTADQTGIGKSELNIKVDKPGAWIRISTDDKILYEGIVSGNKNLRFNGDFFVVRTGNAALVHVSHNGSEFERLGESEQVVEKEYGKKTKKQKVF